MSLSDDIKTLNRAIEDSSNIVFFGGAGVSTESGIPDFRSADGIYSTLYGELDPEQILSASFFETEPLLFYDFYRSKMIHNEAKPNFAHRYLNVLEKQGKLKAIITQNIDGLHQEAGSRNVIELHGSIKKNYCQRCKKSYPLSYIIEADGVPTCSCKGIVRPDVVLYEEQLDTAKINSAIEAIKNARTLIIAGTSLNVYPAASLVRYYEGNELIIINLSPTNDDYRANLVIREKIGEVFQMIQDMKKIS